MIFVKMYVSPVVNPHFPLSPHLLRLPCPSLFLKSPPTCFSNLTHYKTSSCSLTNHLFLSKLTSSSSDSALQPVQDDEDHEEEELDPQVSVSATETTQDQESDDVEVEIIKPSKNTRKITCRIAINANLQTIWNVLTDYEKLADFIPGLAVCQLLEKSGNRVRLFQIGQQNLAFGLKFNAKGIVECYEKDLQKVSSGQRRDIEFKMIEGDFQLFEGKWSIEEKDDGSEEVAETSVKQECHSVLSYAVDVKPKLWLPIGLVEGRLCKEIKLNLVCIRAQAQKAVHSKLDACKCS